MKLTLDYNVSNDFLDNVITSATESGVHGATYWLRVRAELKDGVRIDYDLKEGEEGDLKGRFTMRRRQVLIGIQRLLTNRAIDIGPGARGRLAGAVITDDSGEVDGPLADLIFQAAVFNDVIYG